MAEKFSRFEKTAYHEAGHAVICYLINLNFEKVSIKENNDAFGRVSRNESALSNWDLDYEGYLYPEETEIRIEKEIILSFAGPAAEGKLTNQNTLDVGYSDESSAIDLALKLMGSGEAASSYLETLLDKTVKLISEPQNWAAVQALAEALLEEKEIGYRKARKIIGEAMEQDTH